MIIEYNKIYKEQVKDLFCELQEYIESLDEEGYNIVGEDFRELYFKETMEEIRKYQGKMFLYKEAGKIVGLVIGIVNNEEIDCYNFKAPKRGRITDLVVTKKCKGKGIGKKLLHYMEDYLKSNGCKDTLVGVFSFNITAIDFYKSVGYKRRMTEMIKTNI